MSFHLYEVPIVGKFVKTESRMVVTRAGGAGAVGRYCVMGTELTFYKI